jgi:hypothetical protein
MFNRLAVVLLVKRYCAPAALVCANTRTKK